MTMSVQAVILPSIPSAEGNTTKQDLIWNNMDAPSDEVLTLPSLGQDVQLGMLYDVRTGQFFGGMSLWDNDVVNAKQTLDDRVVQNAEFTYSYSLEEAR